MKTCASILAGMLWASAAVTLALDLYVSPSGGHVKPFTNWTQAATDIQAAVNAAADGDTVFLADHTYVLRKTIIVDKAITIEGYNGPETCLVDGQNSVRCFAITNAALVDLTVQHGMLWGGGIMDPNVHYGGGVDAGSSTISNCVFRENTARQGLHGLLPAGAALAARDGSIVSDCIFYDNNKGEDGFGDASAVHVGNDSLIERCVIRNNMGSLGALDVNHSTVVQCRVYSNQFGGVTLSGGVMRDCEIFDNQGDPNIHVIVVGSAVTPSHAGGGLFLGGGGVVTRCLVRNNGSRIGGGVYISDGILRNSLILNNISHYDPSNPPGSWGFGSDGGGIYMRGIGTVESCTLLNNISSNTTGGICWEPTFNPADDTVIRNNIVYTNNGHNLSTNAYVVSLQNNCIQDGTGLTDGNINSSPQFAADYRLSDASPCRDTGTNQIWMVGSGDVDGITRIVNGTVDMGAFEFVAPLVITDIQYTGGQVAPVWTTSSGAVYQFQGRDNLLTGVWENVGASITATGAVTSLSEATGRRNRRYYRCKHVFIE